MLGVIVRIIRIVFLRLERELQNPHAGNPRPSRRSITSGVMNPDPPQ
jgi:hypothetical protein